MPSKKKSKTLEKSSTLEKLSPEEVAVKNVCNSIENQENRVNCANSKNYNSDNASGGSETVSKEAEHCENGTDKSRIIVIGLFNAI